MTYEKFMEQVKEQILSFPAGEICKCRGNDTGGDKE